MKCPLHFSPFLLMVLSLNACILNWNEKDGTSVTSPVLLPVAVGVVGYNVARSSTLSIEFMRPSDCMRFPALDSHRIVISRKGANGESSVVVDRFISKELEEFKFVSDSDGRYEATVFQHYQPNNVTRLSFTLDHHSKKLLMKLPCLK